MEQKISIGKLPPGKWDYLFSNPFIPENFQWDEPKIRVPFTSQPEFPKFFGKWKTTKESDNFPTHSAELSNQTLYSKRVKVASAVYCSLIKHAK